MDDLGYRRWRAGHALMATLALTAVAGCGNGRIGAADSGSGSSSGEDASTSGPGDPPVCGAERILAPQRRLTRFEYNNTVRDLLGTSLTPADQFPPDEIAGGFNNNATVLTVSALHAEKYLLAAEALATEAVAGDLSKLVPCDPAAVEGQVPQEEACARQFVQDFGRRAYRRPLETSDVDRLMRAYAAGRTDGSFREGIEVVIRAALQSPKFLFRLELRHDLDASSSRVRLDPYEMASRLSYLVWASGPDDELLDAAEAGLLDTREQLAERTRQMLEHPRARRAITEFYKQWLNLGKLETIVKEESQFPGYDDELVAGISAETPAFVEHVLWSGDHKLSSLLTLPVGFATESVAELYGVTVPPGSTTPQLVELPPDQRAGVLTQPAFLAVHAHPDQTSPVLRGKAIRSKFMCQDPPPPPDDVDLTPPTGDEGVTARERFNQHASNARCAGCHQLMDPIGFAFENFDAVGAYRTEEGGQVIDVSGEMVLSDDMDGPFVGVRQLAEKLAGSAQVRECLATQWFRYTAGRFENVDDECSLDGLRAGFHGSEGDLVELIVATTQTDAFLYRSAIAEEE
ncbi:hypothetical protein-transmembrane prediction [Sorangium cellulosum So ce56]|uniref:Uncharacterized protein n=1 Tax=Sorangium cellulosum (strain So ce56) TaxID=448385 RepID=A9EQS7_SORC5|nr:DUF1592 domain-containing protein [Sorangium cellulosum]CAN94178.1 hypothetical protein-transmembrane prediction [Sorangium cellulosum So ce56]